MANHIFHAGGSKRAPRHGNDMNDMIRYHTSGQRAGLSYDMYHICREILLPQFHNIYIYIYTFFLQATVRRCS